MSVEYSIEEHINTISNGYGEEVITNSSWVIYKDDGITQSLGWYPTLEEAQQDLERYINEEEIRFNQEPTHS